jgi:hypothetical protein
MIVGSIPRSSRSTGGGRPIGGGVSSRVDIAERRKVNQEVSVAPE